MKRVVVASLLLLLAGCKGRTELVFGFATDLKAKNQIDHVAFKVFNAPSQVIEVSQEWDLADVPAGLYELPGSFGVYTDNGAEPSLQVDFIGSINIFDGEVKSATKSKITVASPTLGTDVTVEHQGTIANGAKVAIAVRPEKIAIERKKPGAKAAENAIAGKVMDLGYFGKDSLYRVKLPSGAMVRVNAVNNRRAGENERVAVWEDDVWLTFAPSSVIVLTE